MYFAGTYIVNSNDCATDKVFIVQGGYEDWEYYRKTCSTLEGDQQFIQFWEKLSSKTEVCTT